jgi:hypothetical protein
VHHNAQLAVIGVGLVGVKVRDLAHDEKRQQDKAHDRDYQREFLPGAALSTEMCLKSCQLWDLAIHILQKDALILTRNRSAGYPKSMAFVTLPMPGVRVL